MGFGETAGNVHEGAQAGLEAVDYVHDVTGLGGEELAEYSELGHGLVAPIGIGIGAGNTIAGAMEGGPEGANRMIEGVETTAESIAFLPGVEGTPLAAALDVFSGGMKLGHWLDDKLGISDGIADRTSGARALRQSLGLVDQNVRGTAGIAAANEEQRRADPIAWVQNEMHNELYRARMLAQAEPYQHFAE